MGRRRPAYALSLMRLLFALVARNAPGVAAHGQIVPEPRTLKIKERVYVPLGPIATELVMFAGHIGAALAIGRAEKRVNVGAFIVAAVLLDLVLWVFVLLGWESVTIPSNFADTHQPEFVFPYSHGLLAGIGWSVLAGAATFLGYPRLKQAKLRAAVLVAAAVFSHWLLDALVHAPELPIAGGNSPKLGLGLWNTMPVALAVEGFIAVAGLVLFVSGATLSRARKLWLSVLTLLILVLTVAGMTVAPPPPSVSAMAGTSLITLAVVCALAWWLGRPPDEKRT